VKSFSAEKEEYLKLISQYQSQEGAVKTRILAKKLMLSDSSVTEMFQKLSKENLVIYTPYKGVKLTGKGIKYIEYLQRKQELLTQFLEKHLDCSEQEKEELLDQLEHISHELFFDKLEEYLKSPHS
jgi:Mn-dependent DtxR family transcriptional regulator